MKILILFAILLTTSTYATQPPDPTDPATWGVQHGEPLIIEASKATTAFEAITARKQLRETSGITTQRMARAADTRLLMVEKNGKRYIASVERGGTVSREPVQTLTTARVRPSPTDSPIDAGHAAAAAAGLLIGATAASALRRS